tara:strand:- start:936 stop:1142 length:207 start_codon:yes stop_codon:yes gene_type:complete
VVAVELQEELVEQDRMIMLAQQTEQVLEKVLQVVMTPLEDMVKRELDLVEVVMDGEVDMLVVAEVLLE